MSGKLTVRDMTLSRGRMRTVTTPLNKELTRKESKAGVRRHSDLLDLVFDGLYQDCIITDKEKIKNVYSKSNADSWKYGSRLDGFVTGNGKLCGVAFDVTHVLDEVTLPNLTVFLKKEGVQMFVGIINSYYDKNDFKLSVVFKSGYRVSRVMFTNFHKDFKHPLGYIVSNDYEMTGSNFAQVIQRWENDPEFFENIKKSLKNSFSEITETQEQIEKSMLELLKKNPTIYGYVRERLSMLAFKYEYLVDGGEVNNRIKHANSTSWWNSIVADKTLTKDDYKKLIDRYEQKPERRQEESGESSDGFDASVRPEAVRSSDDSGSTEVQREELGEGNAVERGDSVDTEALSSVSIGGGL